MKLPTLIFAVLLVIAGDAYGKSKLKTISLSIADSNKTIQAAAGQEVSIRLPENPTTGYKWLLKGTTSHKVKRLSDKYTADPAPKGKVGVGGNHTFRYRLMQKGTAKVWLVYARPWEKENNWAQRYEVTFNVK